MKRTYSWLKAEELVICISGYMLFLVWDVVRLAALWGLRRRDGWHFRLMLFPALRVMMVMMSYVCKDGSKISEGLYTVFPRIIAVPRLIASPPLLSPSSLPLILSLSSWSAMWSSKTDQWFKLWKLIKEVEKPMFSLFDIIIFWFNGKIKQNF